MRNDNIPLAGTPSGQRFYTISADRAAKMLTVKLEGLWDEDILTEFVGELRGITVTGNYGGQELRCRNYGDSLLNGITVTELRDGITVRNYGGITVTVY